MPVFRSVRTWLLLLVLLSLVPPAGIFVWSAWDSVEQELEGAQADLERVLRGFALEHESAVASTRQLLSTLARLPDVRRMNLRATDAIFRELLKHNPRYANIFLVDADGTLVSSALPFAPVSLSGRKYFRDVRQSLDFSVGEQVLGVTLRRPSFHFAYPVLDPGGRFAGAVAVAIDLGRFGEWFSMARLPAGSSLTISDHRSAVLYRYPEREEHVERSDEPGMVERMAGSADDGLFAADLNGPRRYHAYRRFRLESGGPVYLQMRAGVPEEAILGRVRQTITISALLLAGALMVSLISSWLIGRWLIGRRMLMLVEAAERLGQGDLSQRTGLPHGRDEFGELAQAFDAMAARLEGKERDERRSREAAERLAEEMSVIAEIGRLIGSTLAIDEVYERVAAEARKLIPFDRLNVNLTDYERETVTIAYVSGTEIPNRRQGDTFPMIGSANEIFRQRREGLIIDPAEAHKKSERNGHLFTSLQSGMRSLMSVPLISRDLVIGTLHFRAKEENVYGEVDLRLAERIGAQVAGAIASSQLFAKLGRAEQSLRRSEGEFRFLIDHAPDGVFILLDGRFAYLNQKAVDDFGAADAADLLGRPLLERIHPDHREAVEQRLQRLNVRREAVPTLELRYLRLDGSRIDVESSAVPITFGGQEASLSFVHDITDRKRLESEIREISLRDPLTGLYNRRGFIMLADQQLLAANRTRKPLLLLFMDCDGLKAINDTFGHEAGDRALIDTANVMRQTFREADIVARLGGDEFAVLSIDGSVWHPAELVERFESNVDLFNATGGRPYTLSLSCGSAIYDPGQPRPLDLLMSEADGGMYRAKRDKTS